MAINSFSKSKGNLDDTHTNMRLKEQHSVAPEVVTEKQLAKKDRADEDFEVTTEAQLEKARTGSAEVIIEKNLSDSKGLFGTKHRNPEAYKGDINKVEEKRLSGKKVEDEKYESASSTPKKFRWWEGLKKANTQQTVRIAKAKDLLEEVDPAAKDELDFDPQARFERFKGYDPDQKGIVPQDETDVDLDQEAELMSDENVGRETEQVGAGKVFVTKDQEGAEPLPHIFMEFSFDPNDFGSDEEAKMAAMEKALEIRPNLSGKIDINDFSDPKSGMIDSVIKLRLMGDQYLESKAEESAFSGVEHETVDVGGTPMIVGKVGLGMQTSTMDSENLIKSIINYIADETGMNVPEEAIQINHEKNEATFAFNEPVEAQEVQEEEEPSMLNLLADDEEDEEVNIPKTTNTLAKSVYDFPIVIADAKKN